MKIIEFTTTDDSLLNDDDKYLVSDITHKIVDDEDNILGFICNKLDTPILLDTTTNMLSDESNIFKFFINTLHPTLTGMYIQYNKTFKYYINWWYDNPSRIDAHIEPYIANIIEHRLSTNTTTDIVVLGGNFDNNMDITIDGIKINHVNVINHEKILINITTPNNITDLKNFKFSRFGVESFGGVIGVRVIDHNTGNGPAGDFITNFEGGGNGQILWGDKWSLSTYGGATDIDGFFKSSTNTTPSGTTGPSNNSVFNDGGLHYMFTERSGQNFGSGKYAIAETSYFNDLTSIEFEYHRYGNTMADFIIESLSSDNIWTEQFKLTGPQQSSGSDLAILVTLDTTSWDCKSIRLKFWEASNYSSDMALSYIKLTSIG